MNSKHKFNSTWKKGSHQVIDCETCGFKHLYPLPSDEELNHFYREKYYREIKPQEYNEMTKEKVEGSKKNVEFVQSYKKVFDKVEAFIDHKGDIKPRMVDVGCGNDLLTLYFQQRGWDSVAIEPSKDASNYLKQLGLNVIDKPINDIEVFPNQNVKFINIQFVLEHLANPTEFLQKAYEALEPGGILRVCVPNDFSEGQLAYQDYFEEESHWIAFPDHVNYFTFESLHSLLKEYGFKEVYRTSNFPLEFLLQSGINYYTDPEAQKKVGPIVNQFEASFRNTGREGKLEEFYEKLAEIGLGRSIYLYAQKSVE